MVTWNGIKLRWTNIVFHVFWRNLVQNCGESYSTYITRKSVSQLIFIWFYASKNVCLLFFGKGSKSTLSTAPPRSSIRLNLNGILKFENQFNNIPGIHASYTTIYVIQGVPSKPFKDFLEKTERYVPKLCNEFLYKLYISKSFKKK